MSRTIQRKKIAGSVFLDRSVGLYFQPCLLFSVCGILFLINKAHEEVLSKFVFGQWSEAFLCSS